VGALRKSW